MAFVEFVKTSVIEEPDVKMLPAGLYPVNPASLGVTLKILTCVEVMTSERSISVCSPEHKTGSLLVAVRSGLGFISTVEMADNDEGQFPVAGPNTCTCQSPLSEGSVNVT